MVRAILAGRKTQTRRVMKPQPVYLYGEGKREKYSWKDGIFALNFYPHNTTLLKYCPYGHPGDRLWVRETWAVNDDKYHRIIYKADQGYTARHGKPEFGRWKPSIHMPRSASRINLEITDIRVERLQYITEEDAKAEGVDLVGPYCAGIMGSYSTYRNAFWHLWDCINKKRGHPSSSNPWVWVIEFKML